MPQIDEHGCFVDKICKYLFVNTMCNKKASTGAHWSLRELSSNGAIGRSASFCLFLTSKSDIDGIMRCVSLCHCWKARFKSSSRFSCRVVDCVSEKAGRDEVDMGV